MYKDKKRGKSTKYDVKVKSSLHPNIYHVVRVDLHCYEQMPDEKTLCGSKQKNKSNCRTKH